MSKILDEIGGRLKKRRDDLEKLFAKKADDGRFDWSDEDHVNFNAWDAEVNDLHDQFKKQQLLEEAEKRTKGLSDALNRPSGKVPFDVLTWEEIDRRRREQERQKTLGELVVEHGDYKEHKGRRPYRIDHGTWEFKTLMTTSAGFAPPRDRGPDVVPFALRRPVVQDMLPQMGTESDRVKYMEETTNTANAAPVAEGAVKPESARVYTERSVLVEVIATTLPVTDQQLDDVPQLRGIIDASLSSEIMRVEETQILTGDGTSPNLQGFLTKTGVQTQAKGADSEPTAFAKALTLVRFTGFAEPSASIWHPNDWLAVMTLQDTTGRYIWGDPYDIVTQRIWGIPVVVTPAETENTVLVGDFTTYSYLARRMGIRIDVGFVNDDFKRNQKTIRAEIRSALIIRRPSAFCKVTGM